MKAVIGIPVRMGSTRFPGKPLAKILDMPMVEHVYRRCRLVESVDDVFVAACDEVIEQVVNGFGGKVLMTPKDIARPALRVAEACRKLAFDDDDIVVVVQGDEPLVHPGMIDLAVKPMIADRNIQLVTMVAEASADEWLDPNTVKVVINKNEDILYMSRSPIPSNTRNRTGTRLKQVAIMPFRKKFLLDFQDMEPMPNEILESVELLRAVEHGVAVKTVMSPYSSIAVDTESDRQNAEKMMKLDEFYKLYSMTNSEGED